MSKTAVAIFTGDNHLQPQTWARFQDLQHDAYISWQQIVGRALNTGLPILQLGDLFNKVRPDSRSLHVYMDSLNNLHHHKVDFFFVRGNHDNVIPSLPTIHNWARPVAQLAINGVRFYGIDFCNAESFKQQLQSQPAMQADVVLAHQAWKQIQRNGGCDGDFTDFLTGKVLLTGDYHETNVYHGQAQDGTTVTAYSPGSTCMQAINEPVEKFYGILYDDLSVEWQKLQTRPCLRYNLRTEGELSQMLGNLQADIACASMAISYPEIRKPLVHVTYLDNIPDAYSRLVAATKGDCFLYPAPVRPTQTRTVDLTQTPADAFNSLRSAVIHLSPAGPVRNDTLRLLDSPTPKNEITVMYDEFIRGRNVPHTPQGT
jgi:hypothetical protein